MKLWEINKQLEQIHRIRGLMGDHDTPAGRIKRPPGMKKYLFENRIAKLKASEKRVKRLFEQGINQYIKDKD